MPTSQIPQAPAHRPARALARMTSATVAVPGRDAARHNGPLIDPVAIVEAGLARVGPDGVVHHVIASQVIEDFWLDGVLCTEAARAHRDGDLHIHDLGGLGVQRTRRPARTLVTVDPGEIAGLSASGPPRHLDSACRQFADLLILLRAEGSGAQTVVGVEAALAPFARADGLEGCQVREHVRDLLLRLEVYGRAAPDRTPTELGFERSGSSVIRDAVADVMRHAHAGGRPFRHTVIAEDLDDRSMGHVGTVSINMARLGYLYSGDRTVLFTRLDDLIEVARDTLERRRRFVQQLIDGGVFPLSRRLGGTLDGHVCAIGLAGLSRIVREMTGDRADLSDPRGRDLGVQVLTHVRDKVGSFPADAGGPFLLEVTTSRLVRDRLEDEDRARFPTPVASEAGDGTDEAASLLKTLVG